MQIHIDIKIEYDSSVIPNIHEVLKEGIATTGRFIQVSYYNDPLFPNVHYIVKGVDGTVPTADNVLMQYDVSINTPPTLSIVFGEMDSWYIGILMAYIKPLEPKVTLITLT